MICLFFTTGGEKQIEIEKLKIILLSEIKRRYVWKDHKKAMEKPMQKLRTPTPKEEFVFDVLLRLVEAAVKMNQGILSLKVDEAKAKKFVFLRLPVERRKVLSYEYVNTNQRS